MKSKFIRYVILIDKQKDYPKDLIKQHVDHLKKLEKSGKLVLCGPYQNYAGGIIIVNTESIEEAYNIANADPFVIGGYSTFEIRTLELSCKENNHLGFG